MMQRGVFILWNEVDYTVELFENGVLRSSEHCASIDWSGIEAFLKTGYLPG